MKIWVYALCWNEMRILPFMVDWWKTFADHAVVYDNGSSDGSVEFLRCQAPFVEVRAFGNGKELNDRVNKEVLNSCWKEHKSGDADFVWCCDMDEIPYVPDGSSFREWCERMESRGETIAKPTGIQMVSTKFPSHEEGHLIIEQVTRGAIDRSFSKCCLFSPGEIKDINYHEGHHICKPTGNVRWSTEPLFLLHCKFLSVDYVLSRYGDEKKRLGKENRLHG